MSDWYCPESLLIIMKGCTFCSAKAKHCVGLLFLLAWSHQILTPYSWLHLDMITMLWWNDYFSGAGATDLLVEWEDMFPYWGPIANISAKYGTAVRQYLWYVSPLPGIPTQSQRSPHCYRCPSYQISTHSQNILPPFLVQSHIFVWQAAKENGLGVIPLVQVILLHTQLFSYAHPSADILTISTLQDLFLRDRNFELHSQAHRVSIWAQLHCLRACFRRTMSPLRPLATWSLCWSWQSFLI